MNTNLATIIRDNGLVNIDADNLQVGDIVVLQTADMVPADLKLVEANGLEVGCDTNFRGKRGKIVLEKRKEAR